MRRHPKMRKIVSLITGFAMLICGLNTILMPKATAATSTDWGSYDRVSDASTMDLYQANLGAGSLTTEYSGAVWTDKSVFTSAEAFSDYRQDTTGIGIDMEATNDNFLIALSAMSSNKQIAGYSNLPTDTIIIVDASSSMSHDSLHDMTNAVNAAITKLNSVNEHNRVGVVIFETEAVRFLPLGRYTANKDGVFITGTTLGNNGDRFRFNVASGVLKDGVSFSNVFTAQSGTYTQYGLLTAMEMFLEADPKIDSGEIQGGTTRIPIMVLMTDGEPARSHSDFDNIDAVDDGYEFSDIDARAALLTQLTMAYTKPQIEEHYGTNALYYTLGYDLNTNNTYAQDTLDPENASATNKGYQQTYLNTAVGRTVDFEFGTGWWDTKSVTVERIADITAFDYTDKYFEADEGSLVSAFDTIVQQIILQSAYYVTMTNAGDPDMTGYLTITDTIGEHMDICDIKGMVHEGSLYTGSLFAEAFADPDILNSENGAAIIEIMQHRLNCDDQNAVKLLLSDAIADGQIYYNSDTDFGNSIMWKADADKSYIGLFPHDGTLEDVAGDSDVVYLARSYGYFGGVQTGLDEVNLGYVGVDVFYEVATGQQTVVWTIPASLVPTTTYEVQLSTDDLDNPGDVKVTVNATEALRLVYEVRLDTRIDPVSIGSGAYEDHKNADGTYSFYTNEFDTANLTMSSGNTVADFQPSTGNEFYYYTEDTALYYKDGSEYKLYIGSIPPKETDLQFYTVNHVFNWTKPDGAEGTYEAAATMERIFEPVAAASLANVFKDDGTWYIPKGTQSMYTADYGVGKQVNTTDTQNFVSNPFIIPGTSSDAMGVQDYLGNNGVLTLAPTQGIMVRKECDPPNSAEDVDFTFNIQLTPVDELEDSYPARKVYADGTYEDFMVEPEKWRGHHDTAGRTGILSA